MTIPPLEPTLRNGRVYGRGSYDMKGSAAAIVAAVIALGREHLHRRVLVSLVADEEYAGLGTRDFVARYPADACVVTEPSKSRLVLAQKGFVWAEIVTHGRVAHGSRWGTSGSVPSARWDELLRRLNTSISSNCTSGFTRWWVRPHSIAP